MTSPLRVRIPKPGMVREYLRARIQPPAIPRQTIDDILEHAGLGHPTAVRNVAHGWRTSVVLVTVGNTRIVVRQYPERWTDSAVEHEHSVLLELARRDFLAPRLVGLGGDSYVRKIAGARYSAQSYVSGVTLAGFYLGRAEAGRLQKRIGGLLADFHRILVGFVPAGRHHLGIDPTTGRQIRDLDWHLEVIDGLGSGREVASILGRPYEIASLRTRLVELDGLIEEAELPSAMIHGDYGLHNIIFRSTGEAVVHDFELSRLDIRLLDVAASLSRIRPEFRSTFLQGLLEAGGVDASELALLEPVWEWYRIRGAVQSAEAFTRLGGDHRRTAVAKRLTEAKAIRAGHSMVPR